MIHPPSGSLRLGVSASLADTCRVSYWPDKPAVLPIYSSFRGGNFVMTRRFWLTSMLAGGLAVAIACGKHSATPASPGAVTPVSSDAASDGSTLKATAPTLQSPVKG